MEPTEPVQLPIAITVQKDTLISTPHFHVHSPENAQSLVQQVTGVMQESATNYGPGMKEADTETINALCKEIPDLPVGEKRTVRQHRQRSIREMQLGQHGADYQLFLKTEGLTIKHIDEVSWDIEARVERDSYQRILERLSEHPEIQADITPLGRQIQLQSSVERAKSYLEAHAPSHSNEIDLEKAALDSMLTFMKRKIEKFVEPKPDYTTFSSKYVEKEMRSMLSVFSTLHEEFPAMREQFYQTAIAAMETAGEVIPVDELKNSQDVLDLFNNYARESKDITKQNIHLVTSERTYMQTLKDIYNNASPDVKNRLYTLLANSYISEDIFEGTKKIAISLPTNENIPLDINESHVKATMNITFEKVGYDVIQQRIVPIEKTIKAPAYGGYGDQAGNITHTIDPRTTATMEVTISPVDATTNKGFEVQSAIDAAAQTLTPQEKLKSAPQIRTEASISTVSTDTTERDQQFLKNTRQELNTEKQETTKEEPVTLQKEVKQEKSDKKPWQFWKK